MVLVTRPKRLSHTLEGFVTGERRFGVGDRNLLSDDYTYEFSKPQRLVLERDRRDFMRARRMALHCIMAEYKSMHHAWNREYSAFDARTAMEESSWAQCSNPSEQAELSPETFIDHYFLTDEKPDPPKTKGPIALAGLLNWFAVQSWASYIPGLVARIGGEEPDLTLFIGWNSSEVQDLADKADAEAPQKQKARLERQWEEVKERHREFIKQANEDAQEVDPASQTPPALQKIVGSYVIRCPYIEEQWLCDDEITLDIGSGPSDQVMEAAVMFNVVEGTMRLAFSDNVLDDFDVDPVEESDDDDRTRAAPESKCKPGHPKKEKVDAQTRQIPFRLRGRKTEEWEIFYNSERGDLEFTEDTFTHFKGVADLPSIGSDIEFEGLKVHSEPQLQADAWSEFSERQYEYEQVPQWH